MIFVQYKSVLSIYLRVGSFHLLSNTFETQSEGRVWLFLSVHKTWASTLTVWKSQAFSPFSVKFTSLCCDPSAQLSTPSEFLLALPEWVEVCRVWKPLWISPFSFLSAQHATSHRDKKGSFFPPTHQLSDSQQDQLRIENLQGVPTSQGLGPLPGAIGLASLHFFEVVFLFFNVTVQA